MTVSSLSALSINVLYVFYDYAKLRALCALVPYVSRALRVLLPYLPRILHALAPHMLS